MTTATGHMPMSTELCKIRAKNLATVTTATDTMAETNQVSKSPSLFSFALHSLTFRGKGSGYAGLVRLYVGGSSHLLAPMWNAERAW